jgi:hypothetical protein
MAIFDIESDRPTGAFLISNNCSDGRADAQPAASGLFLSGSSPSAASRSGFSLRHLIQHLAMGSLAIPGLEFLTHLETPGFIGMKHAS